MPKCPPPYTYHSYIYIHPHTRTHVHLGLMEVKHIQIDNVGERYIFISYDLSLDDYEITSHASLDQQVGDRLSHDRGHVAASEPCWIYPYDYYSTTDIHTWYVPANSRGQYDVYPPRIERAARLPGCLASGTGLLASSEVPRPARSQLSAT